MKIEPQITILYGGVSAEREISLGSGEAAAASFSKSLEVNLIDVTEAGLPKELDAEKHVVFSTLHGSFGEDGKIQALLEKAGIVYAGCDSASSHLTFDKVNTKAALRKQSLPVTKEIVFLGSEPLLDLDFVLSELGDDLVIKPRSEGSSVGLAFAKGPQELESALGEISSGEWMIEPRIRGRECTVAVVGGDVFEIVEIKPKSGAYDYAAKYTKGETEFVVPANFEVTLTEEVKRIASEAFQACGCRDFARIDFMVDGQSNPFVLEINTLPGLKETSLLPMSAAAAGHSFDSLLRLLIEPAKQRFNNKYLSC